MKNRIRDVIKYSLLIFGIFSIIFFIYCYSEFDSGEIRSDEPVFIEKWTVTNTSGNSFDVGRTYVDDRAYDEDFVISTTLPDNLSDNSFLCFPTRSDTIVYIDGEVRSEFIRKRDVDIPGGSVKGFYFMVPLRGSDEGADLRIFRGRTDRHPEIAPLTLVTTKNGVYSFLFTEFGVTFFFATMLLLLSLIVIVVSLVMHIIFRRHIDMLYAALGILITSLWIVTNSYLCPFVIGRYYIDGTMNYLCCLVIPMGFLLYLDSIQRGRYTRCLTTLMIIDIVTSVMWTFLHFTGIVPFDRALPYIDLILALIMVCVFIILFVDLKRGHFREYRYTAIGLLAFMLMGVIEVIVLLFIETKHDGIPMLLGLGAFLTCVIVQQISDLLKINREKQRAMELSDAKTRFLAGMSHEIRTPINSILGMNEMIIRENKDNIIDEYARSVRSSGKMLLTLVNDVLDFSKIEAGRVEITQADYKLSRLLMEIRPMVMERAKDKGLSFKTEISQGIPDDQRSDEFRIKQVLINIINNAIKYTDSGSVTLSISGEYTADDRYDLRFTVRDTGRGIKEEDVAYLFDAFSRADMSNNRNIEGTGLGLAIVKNIVDAMGGTIDVKSKYGEGSEFKVCIPVQVISRTPMSQSAAENGKDEQEEEYICDYTAPDAKILAVDDNESNLLIVKLFLRRPGIEPVTCTGGEEAIRLCKETEFDLILLDHMMPEPDGIQALERIRNDADSRNKETPAVILTANAMEGSRQIYLDAGFVDYLTKPIDSELLEQTVKKYLPPEKILPVPVTQ